MSIHDATLTLFEGLASTEQHKTMSDVPTRFEAFSPALYECTRRSRISSCLIVVDGKQPANRLPIRFCKCMLHVIIAGRSCLHQITKLANKLPCWHSCSQVEIWIR